MKIHILKFVNLYFTSYKTIIKPNGYYKQSSRKYSQIKTFSIINDYKLYNLKTGPARELDLKVTDALKFFNLMVRIRELENVAEKMYLDKIIKGFLHLYVGQEACVTGIKHNMTKKDIIVGFYRIHGLCLALDVPPEQILGELAGKSTGIQFGKAGSGHMYTKNLFGGHGIVGAQVPVGTGVAFSNKLKGNNAICFTILGDGAINQGQVYEAFNMAVLWKIPVVYIIENNQYAMNTSVKRASALPYLYQRGHYIPGIWVDGIDVIATVNAIKFAIDYVRKYGPILLEFQTYRFHTHPVSESYITKEIKTEHDPIKLFKKRLLDSGISRKILKNMVEDAKLEMLSCLEEIKHEHELPIKNISSDVLVDPLGHEHVRATVPWKKFHHRRLGKEIYPK